MGGPNPVKNPSLAHLQSRSRFCEGSMNDRTSAAPPVRFLGPDALAALEQPVPLASSYSFGGYPRFSHDTGSTTTSSSGSGGGGGGLGGSFSQTWSRKAGSRLFGQVWEGVRGKLRLRKDDNGDSKKPAATPATAISAATTTTAVTAANAEPITIYTDLSEREGPPASRTRGRLAAPAAHAAPVDIPSTAADFQFTGFQSARPSREEVLASYQQLMAGGFFHSHAIPSNRQGLARPSPAPGTSLPASEAGVRRPTTSHFRQQRQASSPPPQWPLATPRQELLTAMVQSPGSMSSRGTKRTARHDADSDESAQEDSEDDDENDARIRDKENQAPPHPNTVQPDKQPKKRLRRLGSRDSLFVPKVRSSSASASRRSLSTSHSILPAATNKLQKRRPQQQYQNQQQQQQQQQAARPRHVSDGGGSARVLRGRAAEEHRSMRVVPDEGRGIPSVPSIPVRFTYGEDRENNGPWRGLRVR
ncbi:hypothetical protein V2A60_006607 [Cordyceps javanica]